MIVDAEEWENGDPPTDEEAIGVEASDTPISKLLGLDIGGHSTSHLQQGPWFGEGLRVELRPIKHITPKHVLRNGTFYFQCPPTDTFRLDKSQSSATYDTIGSGQFSRDGGRQLTTITFATLTMIDPAPFIVRPAGNWDPKHTAHALDSIMRGGAPVRMVAWHPGFGGAKNKRARRPTVEVNMMVKVLTTGQEERGGEGDARYWDVSFEQWRDPVLNRRRRSKFPRRVRLGPKDTLASLARKNYGNVSEARHIGRSNDNLHTWGIQTRIVKNKHYKGGDWILLPRPSKDEPYGGGVGPDDMQNTTTEWNGAGGGLTSPEATF